MAEQSDPRDIQTQLFNDQEIARAQELLDAIPETIGPYRILERIGGGGMGEVYRAEQRTPIRREVALKVIRLGMDTKAIIARFEAERQALALMEHQHIAKVYDAGVDDTGRPYFVMEYVKGLPLNEYADQQRLSVPERLKLFEQICVAIQHAHHKGIIHRDLKPTNVLVTTQDDRPFVKVIDFGLAKALSQKLTEKTLFTRHNEFVGTPLYVSPEQAAGSLDIDTRSDVYSLGALLYELLTGSPPFTADSFKKVAFDEFRKMVREVDPPKPSTRISESGPVMMSLANLRGLQPKQFGSVIKGELDWIVMKALEKDRQRRYDTPDQLAKDLSAYLNGQPIQAAPPSTSYKLQKFLRRNRSLVLTALVVSLTALGGLSAVVWQEFRNLEIESQARETELRATAAERDRQLADARAQAAESEAELVKTQNESIQREANASRYVGIMGQLAREEMKRSPGWAERSWNLLTEVSNLGTSLSSSSEIRSAAATVLIADEFHTQPDWTYERGRSIAYSPDAKRVAIGLYSSYLNPKPRIHILDSQTGKLLFELVAPDRWEQTADLNEALRSRVTLMSFVDNDTLLAATENGRFFRFDFSSAPPTSKWSDELGIAFSIEVSPNKKWFLLHSTEDGTLRTWDTNTLEPISRTVDAPQHSPHRYTFIQEGYVAISDGTNWQFFSLPQLNELDGTGKKFGGSFHPMKDMYPSADESGIFARSWPDRHSLHEYVMPKNFAFSQPGSLTSAQNARLWKYSDSGRFLHLGFLSEREAGLHTWDAWGGPIRNTLVVPDGEILKWDAYIFSEDDNKVIVQSAKTRQYSRLRSRLSSYRAEGHPDTVRQLTVTPRGDVVLLGERNSDKPDSLVIRKSGSRPDIFTAEKTTALGSIPPESNHALSHSPDGKFIVTAGGNNPDSIGLYCYKLDDYSSRTVRVMREDRRIGVSSFDPDQIAGFGWTQDNSLIVAADSRILLFRIDSTTLSKIAEEFRSGFLGAASPCASIAMNGNDTGWVLSLASGLQEVHYEDGNLRLGKTAIVPGTSNSRICSHDPSIKYVAIGKVDGSVVLFNTASREFGKLHNSTHLDVVQAMVWIDEKRLVTGAKDGSLAVWRLTDAGELSLWYRLDLDVPIVDIAPTADGTGGYIACQDETSLRVFDLAAIDEGIQELNSGEISTGESQTPALFTEFSNRRSNLHQRILKSVQANSPQQPGVSIDFSEEREAAAWVLSAGGQVVIVDMQGREIKFNEKLPSGDFLVRDVKLVGNDGIALEGLQSLSKCRALTHLTLSNLSDLKDEDLQALSVLRLQSLELYRCPDLTNDVASTIGGLKDLRTLRLEATQLADGLFDDLESLPQLQTLIIAEQQMTAAVFNRIFQVCPLLARLDISRASGIQPTKGLLTVATELNSLTLNGQQFLRLAADGLNQLQTATSLHIRNQVDADVLNEISNLITVTSLTLESDLSDVQQPLADLPYDKLVWPSQINRCEILGTRISPDDVDLSALAESDALRELKLDCRDNGQSEPAYSMIGLNRLRRLRPELRLIDVAGPDWSPEYVDVEAERKIAEWVLAIGGTLSVTLLDDQTVIPDVTEIPDREFAVRGVGFHGSHVSAPLKLSDLVVCRSIQELHLNHLTQLDDAIFRELRGTRIQDLYVSSCPNLTNQCLTTLGGIAGLKSARFRDQPVDDSGAALLRSVTLEAVDLGGTNITDAGLLKISDQCPKIHHLSIAASDPARQTLQGAAGFRNLQRLDMNGEQLRLAPKEFFETHEQLSYVMVIAMFDKPLTEAMLLNIRHMIHVQRIDLSDATPFPGGLPEQSLPDIEWPEKMSSLFIHGAGISPSDQDILRLAELPALGVLGVNSPPVHREQCRFTIKGLKKFRELKPNCNLGVFDQYYPVGTPVPDELPIK